MPTERPSPDVAAFARWIAVREHAPVTERNPSEELLAAAREARDEFSRTAASGQSAQPAAPTAAGTMEVLELLAAASAGPVAQPPELLTPRGFRVTLAYDEGAGPVRASICVLVCCPPDLVSDVQGKSAYLWSGAARFELGQFDSDGKAIGTLPAGIEITLADFASGIVRLEAPSPPEDR
jgi:hypothetical protein